MYVPFTESIPSTDVVTVEDRPHQIGELAEKFGITLRTIRFYEERGLLTPRRVSARIRLYDVADVARLSLVVALRRYGLSIDAVAALLTARDREGPETFRLRLIDTLRTRRSEMDAEIEEAERLRDGLGHWLADLDTAH